MKVRNLHVEIYMRQENIKRGEIGERAAVKYLREKGYQIIKRNYRSRYGEIDIICENEGSEPSCKGVLVFVEVKTKTGDQFGEPWEMVGARKLGQIKQMATMYLKKERLGDRLCRIDVVGVWLRIDESVERLKHWENVGD